MNNSKQQILKIPQSNLNLSLQASLSIETILLLLHNSRSSNLNNSSSHSLIHLVICLLLVSMFCLSIQINPKEVNLICKWAKILSLCIKTQHLTITMDKVSKCLITISSKVDSLTHRISNSKFLAINSQVVFKIRHNPKVAINSSSTHLLQKI